MFAAASEAAVSTAGHDSLMTVVLTVAGVSLILACAGLLVPLAKRLSLPYTVLVALFGAAAGAGLAVLGTTDGALGEAVRRVSSNEMPAEALLYLFLPPLLFAAGLAFEVRRLMEDFWPVAILAIVAVLACFGAVGGALAWWTGAPLLVCLLIGAVVAPTDTAAVLNIFKDIGAPRRLSTIVEGESLFNDAVAIALVIVLLGAVAGGTADPMSGVAEFLRALVGGLVVGVVMGLAAAWIAPAARGFVVTEITLTLALAYLSFVAGQWLYGVSGIIASVAAAMAFGTQARTRLTPGTWEALSAQWQQLDFWAVTLIFVFAAMQAPAVLAAARPEDAIALAIVFAAALVSRAAVVFAGLPLLSAAGLTEKVSLPYQTVLWWGGVRGAVTVVLALFVAGSAPIEALGEDTSRLILVMAIGYVLATLLLNAPTLRLVMRALRLNELSPRERMVRDRVLALSRARVDREVQAAAASLGLSRPAGLADDGFGADCGGLSLEERIKVGLFALVAREQELPLDYLKRGLIDREVAEVMIGHAARMFDLVRHDGFDGYQKAVSLNHRPTARFRFAAWAHRRLGYATLLAREIAARIEIMLAKDRLLQELETFTGANLRDVIGADAHDTLAAMLKGRSQAVRAVREGLETQYPDYTRAVRELLVERIALAIEEGEYRESRGQSLISNEVYDDLEAGRRRRLAALSQRPKLDLGLKIEEMIARVPLFKGVSAANIRRLAALLRPGLAAQGERIIRKGDTGREMFFIVSGDVEVMIEPVSVHLKGGDFFGEVALVTSNRRNADIRATAWCELLILRKKDFDALVAATPDLKAQIAEAAAARRG